MIAVGERINGMFKDVKKAIRNKDKSVLQDLALRQTKEGAKYLDINTGVARHARRAAGGDEVDGPDACRRRAKRPWRWTARKSRSSRPASPPSSARR